MVEREVRGGKGSKATSQTQVKPTSLNLSFEQRESLSTRILYLLKQLARLEIHDNKTGPMFGTRELFHIIR